MVRTDLSVIGWNPVKCLDQFWLIIQDLATNSEAIVTTAIANILSGSKATISVLSVRDPLSHYESRLQKMGVSVNIHRSNLRFHFLDGLFGRALWDDSNFLVQARDQVIRQCKDNNQSGLVLILDDVDTILEAVAHADLVDFIRNLLDEGVGVIAIAHQQIDAHRATLTCLKDMADASVLLRRLSSGYTPDLDGQLEVQFFDNGTSPVFHFRQVDGNLNIMERGRIGRVFVRCMVLKHLHSLIPGPDLGAPQKLEP